MFGPEKIVSLIRREFAKSADDDPNQGEREEPDKDGAASRHDCRDGLLAVWWSRFTLNTFGAFSVKGFTMNGKMRVISGRRGWMVLLLGGMLSLEGVGAQEGGELDPNKILEVVRGSYIGEDFEVDGQLRNFLGTKRQPFKLTGQPGFIQFAFEKSGEVYQIDVTGERPVLREAKAGKLEAVPMKKYGDQVQGVSIMYEDLAMRYLYWPGTKVLGEESAQGDKCWKVEVENPGVGGPYARAHLWIGQKSGAILKMDGFNAEGKRVRHFEVVSVHTVGGVWMFKNVRIESYDPATEKRVERVYLETKNPRKSGSPIRGR
jgi:hypothetical protein